MSWQSYPAPRGEATPVIADISMILGAGEFVSVIGPSGCGKSTLFQILAGLTASDSGDVTFTGSQPDPRQPFSAYMPQKDLLFPWLTAEDNAALGLTLRGVSKEAGSQADRRPPPDVPAGRVREVVPLRALGRDAAAGRALSLLETSRQALITQDDFRLAAIELLDRLQHAGVTYAEMFFDPQSHTSRGIEFDTFMDGILAGREEGRQRFGVKSNLIVCFHRYRTAASAFEHLEFADPYRDEFIGLGLDDREAPGWVDAFVDVFAAGAQRGYRLTAHCDVDQPLAAENIRKCLTDLRVDRIDHGINALDDPSLVERLVQRGIACTTCPTWFSGDARPRRVDAILRMRDTGILATLNSAPSRRDRRLRNEVGGAVSTADTSGTPFRLAAVQAAPIYWCRHATTQQGCGLVRHTQKTARTRSCSPIFRVDMAGRRLAGLRSRLQPPRPSRRRARTGHRMLDAVALETRHLRRTRSSERDGGTLYNSILYFNPTGEPPAKHRKLMPAGPERHQERECPATSVRPPTDELKNGPG